MPDVPFWLPQWRQLCVPDLANPVSVTSSATTWAYGTAATISSSFPYDGLIVGVEISSDATIALTHFQLELFVAGVLKAVLPFTYALASTSAGYIGPANIIWLQYPIKVKAGDSVSVALAGNLASKTLAVKVVYVTFVE